MNVWGLDTATRLTGWTAGTGETRPEAGVWKYDHCGNDLGLLLDLFDRDLNALADRLPPHAIIFEEPIKLQWDKTWTLRKLFSMAAHIELWALRRGRAEGRVIVCQEENSKVLKKRLTGRHNAEKPDMVAMAEKLGISLPEGKGREDAADSFAAWLVGIQHHAKEYLPRWDQALYSPRGFLF